MFNCKKKRKKKQKEKKKKSIKEPVFDIRRTTSWTSIYIYSLSLCIFPTGLFFLMPCVDTFVKVDLRIFTYNIVPQEVRAHILYGTTKECYHDNMFV